MILILLLLFIPSVLHAGDLTSAGTISGFDQGPQQSLLNYHDLLAQEALQRRQMAHQMETDRLQAEEQARQDQARRDAELGAYTRAREAQQANRKKSTAEHIKIQAQLQANLKRVDEEEKMVSQMTALQPNWQEVVGKPGSHTPYRQWLAQQPKAYQRHINETMDPKELHESITEFLATQHEWSRVSPAAK